MYTKVEWLTIVLLLNVGIVAVWADEKRLDRSDNPILLETISAIAACVHWAGEVGDQSQERNREIEEGVARDCPRAARKAAAALKRFPADPELAEAILELNDAGHFELSAEEKNRLCQNAMPVFRRKLSEEKITPAYLQQRCPAQFETLHSGWGTSPRAQKSFD
jgi:hypothetical protein